MKIRDFAPFIFPLVVIFICIFLVIRWVSLKDREIKQPACDAYKNSSINEMPARCIKYFTGE